MIIAFSTSSPWASVAALAPDGRVLWQGRRNAPMQASGACLEMIEEAAIDLTQVTAFAADLGPGSFTGVRVGIMLAKTFAWLYHRPTLGADSFDLIDPFGTVVLPSKRGEFFIRHLGSEPVRSTELPQGPFQGFGPGVEPVKLPDASNFGPILHRLEFRDAMELVPGYLIEPSISQPKKPYEAGIVGA